MSSSATTNNDKSPASETRAERIAKYKEQRRKQLTAQYGAAKEQNGASKSTNKREIQLGSASVPGSSNGVNLRSNSEVYRKEPLVTISVNESPIRTTRTSRLRAAAAAAAASLSGSGSNSGSTDYLGHSKSPSPRLEASVKEKSPSSSRLEKDKSAKRKSNLNRSTCSEETADQNDDKSRRRRRRFFPPDVFSSTSSSLTSSPSQPKQTSTIEPLSTSLTSLLPNINTSLSNLSSLSPRSTTSSHLASPIAVATAVAVSIASPSTSTRTNRDNGQQMSRMGSAMSSNGKGDINRMGAVRKMSASDIEAKTARKEQKGKVNTSAASPSPRFSDERNLHTNSNKENIRSRRSNLSNEPLGRRLDQLTALTQETLAKVKSLENRSASNNNSGKIAIRSKSSSKSSSQTSNPPLAIDTIHPNIPAPVSILKRKVSQEECKSIQTPPVTFSPSVIDPPVATSKRQGILKKRRSLDESQVMRHRSCSPDKSNSKSILKYQKRRSSLEEIAHRVGSPDATGGIPGILKRKTLKLNYYDDLLDNTSLNSPQSILKRRSGASSAGSMQDRYVPHVSIATAVILAAAGGAEMILDQPERVKPILKKKSFSDECSGSEAIGQNWVPDGLKPILKKKSSTDTDECGEDRPKRPILKLRSFQQDSQEYYDCNKSRQSLNNDSGSECEVKPILKQSTNKENEQYKPRLSFCEGQSKRQETNDQTVEKQVEDVAGASCWSYKTNYDSGSDCDGVKPILKQSLKEDHYSKPRLSFCSSGSEYADDSGGQSADRIFSRRKTPRRSNTICSTEFNFDRRVVDKEMDREVQKPRTLSVLELVKSFETTSLSGAIPKKSSLKRHSSERFKTQPITVHELQASGHISNNLSPTPICLNIETPLSPIAPHSPNNISYKNFHSLFNLHSPDIIQEITPYSHQPHTINNIAQSKSDTELLALPTSILNSTNKSISSELYSNCEVAIAASSCVSERGGIMSSDSAFQSLGDGLELEGSSDDSDNEHKGGGTRNSSGDEMEESMLKKGGLFSGVIRVMPPTPPGGFGPGITGVGSKRQMKGKSSRNRKIDESSSRFSTQPITTEEVAEAAKLSEKATNSEEEFEPAHLSIMDKIKFFKMKTTEDTSLTVPKRCEFRRSTQPITIDEVDIARKKPHKPKIDSESSPSDNIKPILKPVQFKRPALSSQLPKTTNTTHFKLPTHLTSDQTIACDEGISSDSGSDSEPARANRVVRRSLDRNARELQTKSKIYTAINSALESNSDESSGGREIHSIISKEAMAAAKKRRENLIYKSKSHAALPLSPQALIKLNFGHKSNDLDDSVASNSASHSNAEGNNSLIYRSVTQSHLATKGSSIDNSSSAIAMRRNMICELQQQLAQSGNSDWLKRRHKMNGAGEELSLLQANNERNEELNGKPSILATKLDELDASSKTWKTRVEKSDAINYSVAGKMQEKDVSLNIPTPDKHKRTPHPKRFKGKLDCELDTSSTPASPEFEKSVGLKRSTSVQAAYDDSVVTAKKVLGAVIVRTVKINRPDDETFSSFFENTVSSNEKIVIDDLDCITRESNTLLVQRKNIQVVRRRVASRNPVKTLAKRSDLRSEYTEVSTGVVERETKRLNMEKLAKSASCNLAMEALAGLASKEDFSAVVLKKSSSTNPSQHLPYTDLMLLQIKGRKHIQTRLVEPTLESINFGDNYLLITSNCLYSFTGTYSNVIEQSRMQDIANYILQNADLGCKTTGIVNVDVSMPGKELEQFKKLLSGQQNNESTEDLLIAKAGNVNEDEIYESSIIQTNMIYKLENDELVPYDEYWGCIPKVSMLDENQCFVFDFGSEMYIWSGKTADKDRKKTILRLGKELWSTGYNYTECSVCPINVSKKLGSRTSASPKDEVCKGDKRPAWALFAKLTQNRETILFKEKFLDWPDFTRVIRVKSPSRGDKSDSPTDIKPLELPDRDNSEPNFVVENTCLGRGKEFFDVETRRNFEITTRDVTGWNIMENTYEKLENNELGQFYEGDTYIIRWNFRVTITGKDLSGKPSKHLQLGRDRCCYFCWFGKAATINEKGTAALLTVELDSENAKQYRISQEHEPPAFLQLFAGKMIIYRGRREKNIKSSSQSKKLFMVRGHSLDEASLLEVPLLNFSLRSRTSFILQEPTSVKLWHGSKSSEITKDIAKSITHNMDANFKDELFERKEDVLLVKDATSFVSLKNAEEEYNFTPRLFYFSSVSGNFEVTEVLESDRRSDIVMPYPILQSDLYNENQPALFLLDNHHILYLWHGWWPPPSTNIPASPPLSPSPTETTTNDLSSPSSGSQTPELPSDLTGSGRVRWHAERRAVMLSAVKYYKKAQGDEDVAESGGAEGVPVTLVWAGLEPDGFVMLFPTWDIREDVKILNLKEDKVPGQSTPLHEELALLSRNRFTLEELRQRPLPIGVDPTHLETYLSDSEFESLLKMNREDFKNLPTWKQTTVKKEHGLF